MDEEYDYRIRMIIKQSRAVSTEIYMTYEIDVRKMPPI